MSECYLLLGFQGGVGIWIYILSENVAGCIQISRMTYEVSFSAAVKRMTAATAHASS